MTHNLKRERKNTMRTDIHCEKNLIPEDYEVFTYFYCGPFAREIEDNLVHLRKTYKAHGVNIHPGLSQCDHCGSWYHEGVMIEHNPTGKLLTIGWQCAEKRFALDNLTYARKMAQKKAKGLKARAKKWFKIREFVRENRKAVRNMNAFRRDSDFVNSVRNQLIAKGQLSEKQVAAMVKVGAQIQAQAARKAKWAEQDSDAEDVVVGKVTITGTIISQKLQDGYYGSTWKMLVRDDRGFKVWGSIPSKFEAMEWDEDADEWVHALKGKRVAFTANVTASDKDSKFGFFKRPTKASMEAA